MQVTVNLKDDRSEIGSALQKRISVLEGLLKDIKKSGKKDTESIVSAIRKANSVDTKRMSALISSLKDAIGKKKVVKSEKITREIVKQKGGSTPSPS